MGKFGRSNAQAVLRHSLSSGAALAVLVIVMEPAQAQPFGYRYNPYFFNSAPPPRAVSIRRHSGAPAGDSIASKKPNPEKDGFAEIPKNSSAVLQIGVSIGTQRLTLYRDGVKIAQAPVSTGTPGHPTPTGVFSIIEKDRYHHSNLYGNAPMYFMQRITWSGVAMHEGVLPGVPASHGCIRMPHDFAARLWPTTKLGVRVIVAHDEHPPVDFAHPALFLPKQKPAARIAMNDATDGPGVRAWVRLAQASPQPGEVQTVHVPLPEITSARGAEDLAEVQASGLVTDQPAHAASPAVGELRRSVEAAPEKGGVNPAGIPSASEPGKAVTAPSPSDPEKPAAVPEPPKPIPGRVRPADQPVKRSGQVAVFVSRKENKIFVRQGFVTLFAMPITIEHPDLPLGTHVFTAMAFTDDGASMRWNLVTVPNAVHWTPERREARGRSRQLPPLTAPAANKPASTAAEALDRIQFPPEAVERISELLIPGSSLVISDDGLGRETGRMTEFIVLTH